VIQLLSSEGVIAETQSAENGQFELHGSFGGRFQLVASQNGYIDLFARPTGRAGCVRSAESAPYRTKVDARMRDFRPGFRRFRPATSRR